MAAPSAHSTRPPAVGGEGAKVPTRTASLTTVRSAQLPLLLIKGAQDTGVNDALASTLTAIAEASDARVVPLPDAGHFANMEQPERFDAVLNDFLGDVAGRRSQSD